MHTCFCAVCTCAAAGTAQRLAGRPSQYQLGSRRRGRVSLHRSPSHEPAPHRHGCQHQGEARAPLDTAACSPCWAACRWCMVRRASGKCLRACVCRRSGVASHPIFALLRRTFAASGGVVCPAFASRLPCSAPLPSAVLPT